MSIWDKVKSTIRVPEDNNYEEEDGEIEFDPSEVINNQVNSPAERAAAAAEARQHLKSESNYDRNKVVNIHTTAKLQVVLLKPESFADASDIADHLNNKRTVVLNLESAAREVSRRLVDFLSGVAYANGGQLKRVANSTYIITPYNVDVMGDLIDELENNGMFSFDN